MVSWFLTEVTHFGSFSSAVVEGQRQRRFQFLELCFKMESRPATLWFKVVKVRNEFGSSQNCC